MKMSMLIGFLALGAGLAGVSAPARAQGGVAGRWQGVLLRDGVQVPISVELSGTNQNLSGELRIQDMSAAIRSVRATLTGVRFDVGSEGIFEGTVAGDAMAGTVSGAPAAEASFSLARESNSPFGDAITSSGP
jgi:hypothetical protein